MDRRTFFGKIDRAELGMTERAVMKMVKAPYGDFRGCEVIRHWANEIAAELTAAPA